MNRQQIAKRLRKILNRDDVESDGMINRKPSSLHEDDLGVLLDHLGILVAYLKLDVKATRKELFEMQKILDEQA